jgi:hypothetical protein
MLPTDLLTESYPDEVPGRVVHIDADFACYQATYIKKGEKKSWDDMTFGIGQIFENLRKLSGAEKSVLHTTPEGSDKGGRYEQATTHEYQGNRTEIEKDPEHTKRVHAIRQYVVDELGGIAHLDMEADDGMAMAGWKAHYTGESNLCVISSADKDLRMVPGWHCNPTTGILTCEDNTFGSVYVDDTKSTKKVVGYGTKFFWAQMLMGDTADNIPGLHKASAKHIIAFKPSGKVRKAITRLTTETLTEKQTAAQKKILADVKSKSCGPMLAFDIIKDVSSDKEAFELVKGLYKAQPDQLTHWDTAEDVTWQEAFMSNARLLWMRRSNEPDDVLEWFKEINK